MQHFRPNIDQVMETVLEVFAVDITSITGNQRGRREENIPRWVVMYLGQELCGLTLRQIADQMSLTRTGSISITIGKLKQRMNSNKGLRRKLDKIKSQYYT